MNLCLILSDITLDLNSSVAYFINWLTKEELISNLTKCLFRFNSL